MARSSGIAAGRPALRSALAMAMLAAALAAAYVQGQDVGLTQAWQGVGRMATAGGFGALIPVAMTLAGIVSMARVRSRRRRNAPPPRDESFERRQAAAAEMERRMASYLAGRSAGGWDEAPGEDRKQETER